MALSPTFLEFMVLEFMGFRVEGLLEKCARDRKEVARPTPAGAPPKPSFSLALLKLDTLTHKHNHTTFVTWYAWMLVAVAHSNAPRFTGVGVQLGAACLWGLCFGAPQNGGDGLEPITALSVGLVLQRAPKWKGRWLGAHHSIVHGVCASARPQSGSGDGLEPITALSMGVVLRRAPKLEGAMAWSPSQHRLSEPELATLLPQVAKAGRARSSYA